MAVETHEFTDYKHPASAPKGRIAGRQHFLHEATAAQLDGDATSILKLLKVHRARLITGFQLFCDDLDSGGTPALAFDLIVTDGTTTKVLLEATDVAQAGGVKTEADATITELVNLYNDFIDSQKWYLALRIDTAAATAAAGTIAGYLDTIGQ